MRISRYSLIRRPAKSRLRRSSPLAAMLAVGVLLALMALAGCGITTAAGPAPGGAGASPSATASARSAACPGPAGSVNDAGTPVLILTDTPGKGSGSAAVGALVQVRVPDSSHWDYLSAGTLAPLMPAGVHDTTLHVCVWNFRPQKAGSMKLSFARSAICRAGVPCPMYMQQVAFALQVTQ